MAVRCSIVALGLSLAASAASRGGEGWVGYEGYQHQSSSPTSVAGELALAWEARFAQLVTISGGWDDPGCHQSRNLACLDGRIAVVASVEAAADSTQPRLTILDAATGAVVTCVKIPYAMHGAYKSMHDATDTAWGEHVIAWDPDTGILFTAVGGDMPGHAAVLPLANAPASWDGVVRTAVGAYASMAGAYPDLMSSRNTNRAAEGNTRSGGGLADGEWDGAGRVCNRAAFFDVQPGSPYLVECRDVSHCSAYGSAIANKHTGLCAKKPLSFPADFDSIKTETGYPAFKFWNGILVSGTDVYFIGPYEEGKTGDQLSSSSLGLRVSCVSMTPTDLQGNGGYAGQGVAETAVPASSWQRTFASTTAAANESWHQCGAYNEGWQRNKAWFVEGSTAWVAWKPSTADTVRLVAADASGSAAYDLGVGAGMRGQDVWPNIAWAPCGAAGTYVAYYLANSYTGTEGQELTPAGPATLTVFRVDGAPGVRWTYTLRNADGSGAHPGLPPNPPRLWYERSRMVVAGTRAYVAWVAASGSAGTCALEVVSFDVTSPNAPAAPVSAFAHDLGIARAGNNGTRLIDLIAVDGCLYALVTEDADVARPGRIAAQRIVALHGVSSPPPTCELAGTVSVDLPSPEGVTMYVMSGATVVDAMTLDATGQFAFDLEVGAYTIALALDGYTIAVDGGATIVLSADVAGFAVDATATEVEPVTGGGTGGVSCAVADGSDRRAACVAAALVGVACCVRARARARRGEWRPA